MPLARVNDANLYYEITGTAEERIVLVHSSWGNHANWSRLVPRLADSFRVQIYDWRGHSQSEPPTIRQPQLFRSLASTSHRFLDFWRVIPPTSPCSNE